MTSPLSDPRAFMLTLRFEVEVTDEVALQAATLHGGLGEDGELGVVDFSRTGSGCRFCSGR